MPKFRIGIDNFKELIDDGGYFVDKSEIIREIVEGNKVVLLPRPRRFGKTLNMTMLKYFFEKSEEDRAYLFANLAISKWQDVMNHQGRYPVIFISLKQVKGATYAEAELSLRKVISQLYLDHKPTAAALETDIARKDFEEIRNGSSSISALKSSLRDLIGILYEYHHKPVIVLIDEYDSPMIDAWTGGYYQEMAEFMRSWLGGGLKHENAQALYRAVITGIMRVAKESIFSDLNNLDVSTTLQPNNLSTLFGFTEDEINKILIDFKMEGQGQEIRSWYNGYKYGTETIYNPWSVSVYISKFPSPPAPHWLNTSSNALVYEELAYGGLEIKQDLEKLLAGEDIRYPISETITFRDIGRSPDNIWSFLYFSGYLSATDPQWAPYNPRLLTYAMSIPNQEIACAYQQFVNNLYTAQKSSAGIRSFLSFFLENKPVSILERSLETLTLSLVSTYDLSRFPEAVFHAFVLGLLANLRTVYEIRSNPEAGLGRADILMRSKTQDYPVHYIIEFKSVKPKKDIEKEAKEALSQIREKKYEMGIHSDETQSHPMRRIAVVLQGKRVIVRE